MVVVMMAVMVVGVWKWVVALCYGRSSHPTYPTYQLDKPIRYGLSGLSSSTA